MREVGGTVLPDIRVREVGGTALLRVREVGES